MIIHETYLDVRYYETDLMGIVHHSNYVRYFECGRIAMLEEMGIPIHKIEESGIMLPVISVECRYRIPTKMGDRLKIISKVERMPMAKMIIKNEIYNQNNEMVCDGTVAIGFIHSDTRRPTRAPKIFTDIAEKYFMD
ncbi:MAG: acyl-CoA thioesterase [Bacteroidales bacterium]|nr:acyl-CoA thioesterase [Bacteroidales bacterium]